MMTDKIWIDEAAKMSPEDIAKLRQAWEKAMRGVHSTDLGWYWIPCDRLMPEVGREVPVTYAIKREQHLGTAWLDDECLWWICSGEDGRAVELCAANGITVLAWLDIAPWKGDQ